MNPVWHISPADARQTCHTGSSENIRAGVKPVNLESEKAVMKKVVKFGGTSLASAKQFKKAASIIKEDKSRRYIIPSAPGKRTEKDTKVTDLLYECYDKASAGTPYGKIFGQIKDRFYEIIDGLGLNMNLDAEFASMEENFVRGAGRDYAGSRGEYISGLIMAEYLGFPFVDAADVIFFDEDGNFLSDETNRELAERLETMERAAIPGFYGSVITTGEIRTFSRGGSDITGSLVARAIHADLYENWTDVSGFLVADPRIVKDPEVIETITYKELRELSYMGAGVLHEDSIFPVRNEGIPINIRNTNKPKETGTLIVESTCRKPRFIITGIAGKKGFCSVNIEKAMMNSEIGFGRKVLQVFEDNGLSFEHMPSGVDTMSIVVHQEEFEPYEQAVLAGIHRAGMPDSVEVESDIALIAVVGRGMKASQGVAGRLFSALGHARVNVKMIDQGSSELNIIVGVRNEDFETAIRVIYDIFINTEL